MNPVPYYNANCLLGDKGVVDHKAFPLGEVVTSPGGSFRLHPPAIKGGETESVIYMAVRKLIEKK